MSANTKHHVSFETLDGLADLGCLIHEEASLWQGETLAIAYGSEYTR